MAPLPKPPGTRRRERPTQGRWRTLPPAQPFKRPPALPVRKPTWLKVTRDWWEALWTSPMATAYMEPDVPALVRLAEMVEDRARGNLSATEVIAMTALEDRFGLSPKARRALQWEIAQAEQAQPPTAGAVPRLRLAT